MGEIIDLKQLDAFSQELLELAEKKVPKEVKKFMKKEGRKLKGATVKKAKAKTNKKTGNYYKGIKEGKVYIYRGNGGTAIRVYAASPAYHAHLIEYGHRQIQKGTVFNISGNDYITKGNKPPVETGFVRGLHVFEQSAREFFDTFHSDIEQFLDKVIKQI